MKYWKRFGRKEALFSLTGPLFFYTPLAFIIGYIFWPYFYYIKDEHFIVIGLFAIWRYGWMLTNYIRSIIYQKYYYPRLYKKAQKAWESSHKPEHIYFVIPSYKEKPWITHQMLQNLLSSLSQVPINIKKTIIIESGSEKEDKLITHIIRAHPSSKNIEIVLQRQKHGKRNAMGFALRAIARRYFKRGEDYNSVTFFMDGDTAISKKAIKDALSFFLAYPRLAAITTNEVAYIASKSKWYRDWFNMKFGQRHIIFCSHSLSHRVLTLTGRFSAFRTCAIIDKEFIERLENDYIFHPFWGKFRFLMGDDKTTWYQILKRNWDMLYLPNIIVYSLESRNENFLSVSLKLLFRWYGNTLRNTNRALKLGPQKVGGFFIWLAILDQKLSMWTALVGPLSVLFLSVKIDPVFFPIYIAWILIVRTIQISIIAIGGHLVNIRTLPLMLYNQWVGAIVKIWVNFHLADQYWKKGTKQQKISAKIDHKLANFLPNFAMLVSIIIFVTFILASEKILAWPDNDIFRAIKWQKIYAKNFGVTETNKENAKIINKLIKNSRSYTEIILPSGTIFIEEPIILKSNIKLKGKGINNTIIQANENFKGDALIKAIGIHQKTDLKLTKDILTGENFIALNQKPLTTIDYIIIREKNTQDFLNKINSKCWFKQWPYIKFEIFEVKELNRNNTLVLGHNSSFDFNRNITEILKLSCKKNIVLSDFTIKYNYNNLNPPPDIYMNLLPQKETDLIKLQNVCYIDIKNLKLLNAIRHPLNLDTVFKANIENLFIDGAWNKGKGGNGYFRIARTFFSNFQNITIKNIRHLTLQWSSAYNQFRNLELYVDFNLHGGYPHHNTITNIRFYVPWYHPWAPIYFTPFDACYAPPNGPHNIIEQIKIYSL